MQHERRRHRSNQLSSSLSFYFHSALGRLELDALVLADDRGLVVGDAGPSADAEALAAFSASVMELERRMARHGLAEKLADAQFGAEGRRTLSFRRVVAGGELFVLCGLGDGSDISLALEELAPGVVRILEQPLKRLAFDVGALA
jgi:hypothetical protein